MRNFFTSREIIKCLINTLFEGVGYFSIFNVRVVHFRSCNTVVCVSGRKHFQ